MEWIKLFLAAFVIAFVVILIMFLNKKSDKQENEEDADEKEDLIKVWNSHALRSIRTVSMNPPKASRMLAMLHLAMFDAWNGTLAAPRKYHSFAYAEESDIPLTAVGASNEAAIANAAHDVLVAIMPAAAIETPYKPATI